MIETPSIVQTSEVTAAVIRVAVPRAEIQGFMGAAIAEVIAAVAAQHIGPVGPVFAHHLRMDAATFDMEVGVPVSAPMHPVGRVKPGKLPAATVARSVYHGPYEGLHAAWGEFDAWMKANGFVPAQDLWECYAKGPETSADPAAWRTELNRPLR